MIPFLESNVLSWLAQVLIVGGIGAALLFLAGFRHARTELVCIYTILVVLLVLPFVQPWERASAGAPVPVSSSTASPVDDPEAPVRSIPWNTVIVMALAIGIIVRLAWIALGLGRIHAYRRAAEPLIPAPAALRDAVRFTGANARFLVTDAVETPVTFGWLEPAVVFPKRFLALEQGAQFGIACHELLHVRRRDWFLTLAEELYLALFWFHPATWWLAGRSRLARELLVDAEAIRLTGDRDSYVRTLLDTARMSPARRIPSPAAPFGHPRRLARRVRHLFPEVHMSRIRLALSYASVFVGFIIATFITIPRFPLLAATVPAEPAILAESQGAGDPGFVVRRQVSIAPDAEGAGSEVVVLLTFNGDGEIVDSRVISGPDHLRQMALQSAITGRYPVETPQDLQVVVEFTPRSADAIRVSAGVAQGNLIQRVQPEYPEDARRNGVQGVVILEAEIGADGRVTRTRALSGIPILVSAAQAAVRQWTYSPLMLDGQAVPQITTVHVAFTLQ